MTTNRFTPRPPADGGSCNGRRPALFVAIAACWLTIGGTLTLLAEVTPGGIA